jgi:hypothetical protein
VSSALILLRENSIPTIRLSVDPAHTAGEKATDAKITGLGELLAAHSKLSNLAAERATATFSVTILDEKDKVFGKLELSDWIVTSAGVGQAAAVGAFSVQVEIQHPITKIDAAGINLGNLRKTFDLRNQGLNTEDIVSALVSVIGNVVEGKVEELIVNDLACGAPDDITVELELYNQRLEDAAQAMSEHLEYSAEEAFECTYTNWPLQSLCLDTDEALRIMASTLYGYVLGVNDVNLWETLVHSICDQWSLTVIPTYWEATLKLAPYTPWGYYQIKLRDYDISVLNFPAADPAPIGGIGMHVLDPGSGADYTTFQSHLSDGVSLTTVIPYLPEGTKNDESKERGRIVMLELPGWLRALKTKKASAGGKNTAPTAADKKGLVKTPAEGTTAMRPASADGTQYSLGTDQYLGAAYHCAHQAFLSMYRSGVQLTISTRLLLTTEFSLVGTDNNRNGYITPGYVCRIEGPPAGTEDPEASGLGYVGVFDFYITDVVHTIDFQNGAAGTQISGRYVRPPGGVPDMVPSGQCNPLYTSSEEGE